MEIVDIEKEQFLFLLLNKDPFGYGCEGIITLINGKLYKVYYKDFIKTCINKNDSELDFEVKVKSAIAPNSLNIKLEEYSRLLETKSNDLITGVLSYKGVPVGIEMNYYEGYMELYHAAKYLSEEKLDEYINTSYELAEDLMLHNIVPGDINETNILVNIETGDVKLIDLDGYDTTYGPEDYIKKYPHNVEWVKRKFDEMKYRLKNNNYKKESRKNL